MNIPQVSISKCPDYQMVPVRRAVRDAVGLLGGMENFVDQGDSVLLKVNLLFPSRPDKAVTSHPTVVKAIIEQIESAGGSVIVGDSPGGPFIKSRVGKAYRKSGMYEAIEGTKAELNWNLGTIRVPNPGGKLIKSLEVIQVLEEVDKVITVPKLKTHSFTTFTGATKILYGVVPGMVKAAYHSRLPDANDFSEMLLDIQEYVKPELAVMDAVVGMDGAGPSAGEPKKVGAIIASCHNVSLDIVACCLVDIDPLSVPTIRKAVERGMVTGKASDIDVRGVSIEDFADVHFEPAIRKENALFRLVFNLLGGRMAKKPVPHTKKCTGCGECALSCPRHCIMINKGLARMNYKECIRCYCCHELCPESAIDLK